MKKRLRKKRHIKKYSDCKYPVQTQETYSLYSNIAEYILPRLKLFKKLTIARPVGDETDTLENWKEILDKMILAFEYIIDENWWINDSRYDYTEGLHFTFGEIDEKTGYGTLDITQDDWVSEIEVNQDKEALRRNEVIKEGLALFTKYYMSLWW